MFEHYQQIQQDLQQKPKRWLVTGCAGFIGSHLVESLLKLNQTVVGMDNLSSGLQTNLDAIQGNVSEAQWHAFEFLQADVTDSAACQHVMQAANIVLHHAAIASVPYSLQNPQQTHQVNVNGMMNLLLAARDAKVEKFIYASSSAVYGNEPTLPKREHQPTQCLSPYALSKLMNEQMAELFFHCYGLHCIGLRYFNIYGPRQNVNSQYGAVIPTWLNAISQQQVITIYGDGKTSRDFCYIEDVVQANLLAATQTDCVHGCFNIGCGQQTSLAELLDALKAITQTAEITLEVLDERVGDVKHSVADIAKAKQQLSFQPSIGIKQGLARMLEI